MKALILVDIQNDFLPGGPLAVPGGNLIIPLVNRLQEKFDLVIATQDWHPPNHQSFASNHPGKRNYEVIYLHGQPQVLWPDHCLQGSLGACFPHTLHTNRIEAIIRKGTNAQIDSYSAFFDNGHQKPTGLAGYLHNRDVTEIYLTGLAGDICVYYTGMDGLHQSFKTYIVEDAIRPLRPADYQEAMDIFVAQGGQIVQSYQIQ